MRRWKSFPSIFDKHLYHNNSLPVAAEKNACESTFASRKSLHSGCLPVTTCPHQWPASLWISFQPHLHQTSWISSCWQWSGLWISIFSVFLIYGFVKAVLIKIYRKVNSFLFIYDSRIALDIGQHLWILVLFRRGFQFVILGRIRLLSSGVQLHSNVIIFLFQNTTSKIWGFIKHTESWTFLPLQPILNHSLHVLLTLRARPLSSPTHVFLGGSINDKGHTRPTTIFN